MAHVPVMPAEVVQAIQAGSRSVILDGTVGYGGHARAVLASVDGPLTYVGLDRDAAAIAHCQRLFDGDKRVQLRQGSYSQAAEVLNELGLASVDAVLLDLGASSPQFDEAARGFSFQQRGPLDMRFDQSQAKTAAQVVNTYKEADLTRIIAEYGEERHAKRIAKAIVAARQDHPLETTGELADLVAQALPRKLWPKSIHPATRTFQALRIEVNDELRAVESALPTLMALLKPGGRIAVISFHSLEDRLVKQFFRQASRDCVCPPDFPRCACQTKPQLKIITKKPITATDQEQKHNPRSRSAKLRVAEKL